MKNIQIAIDGPAGAGKSTVARMVAEKLKYIYIDTGAMYRAVALLAMQKNISPDAAAELASLAAAMVFKFIPDGSGKQLVTCDGLDITEAIRRPEISRNVSIVASHRGVRQELVKKQQLMARNNHVVMDGRDVGTVVLPQADCKIFLTATLEERAGRRYRELLSQGYQGAFEDIKTEMAQRDKQDTSRAADPLKPAEEAVLLDTTGLTLPEVVEKIIMLCCEKKGETGK